MRTSVNLFQGTVAAGANTNLGTAAFDLSTYPFDVVTFQAKVLTTTAPTDGSLITVYYAFGPTGLDLSQVPTIFSAKKKSFVMSLSARTNATLYFETQLIPILEDTLYFWFSNGALGFSVTLTVDMMQQEIPNTVTASVSNVTSVASSTSVVQLVALNSARRAFYAYNNATTDLYLKFGMGASSSSYSLILSAKGFYEMPTPIYPGIITGVWAGSPTGAVSLTELS